ncbi:hypothetical protein ACFSC3_12010 [Sphingomonas floccifaciens]|uniref:DNA-binding protein n=1 Tax=Sphingomonas floccifaciens TaxID=1844115 RepID=A0ABW4NDS1_9SPHN
MDRHRRKSRELPMATISPDEFAQYRRYLPAVTKAGVMATYHISQHSWYKLRDGKPVKISVLATLRRRFAVVTGVAG